MILDSDYLKRGAWVCFSVLVFAMILGLSVVPFFWPVYLFIFILKLSWFLYLIYFCERFTFYMWSVLASVEGFLIILASSIAYLSAADVWGAASAAASIAGLLPTAFVLLVFYIIAHTKPSFHPFEYSGNKVKVVPKVSQSTSARYPVAWSAGASTLAASVFIKFFGVSAAGVIGAVVLAACALVILYHMRHTVRALRTLSMNEKKTSVPYTFMQIDEIRQARSRWWISRLFKWVSYRRKSPSA
ncbi:hypothetical protein [Pseudomonas sp. LP_7_YM]|uniref:hypothetical protein n=1 Tax=Pseudomonas sp. LP_7_YM TaxID=2485137 RepID=UPI0010D53645|nr:hypothetical protein [Pseudomonas sp. LP_7_YM]TDV58658.1 hypothetical protein EC915_1282 [Pseudomonas sp. LP_7_YM]